MSYRKGDLEGGFVKVKNKLWRGTIRTKESQRIIWTCKHRHSRPEFNARYAKTIETTQIKDGAATKVDEEYWGIWEYSALNCGRAAYRQWPLDGTRAKVFGEIGDIGSSTIPPDERPDFRRATVGSTTYIGQVDLNANGYRILTVRDQKEGVEPLYTAKLNLELGPKKGLTLPEGPTEDIISLLTALWLLQGTVWGMTFQDHRVSLKVDGPMSLAVSQLLGDEKKEDRNTPRLLVPRTDTERNTESSSRIHRAPKKLRKLEESQSGSNYGPSSAPRIEISQRSGRRFYEVVDTRGVVIASSFQRGKMTAELEKLRGGSR
jgi:hypothetical protein